MAKFCGSCGAPLNDGAKFCGKCGAAQTVNQNSAPPPPQQSYNRPDPPPQQNYNRPNPPPQQFNSSQTAQTSFDNLQEMFLSTNGRLNRMRFFKRNLAVVALELILVAVIIAIFGDAWGNLNSTGNTLLFVVIAASLVPQFCLGVRRVKDIGKLPAWKFTETNINIFVGIYIAFCFLSSEAANIIGIHSMNRYLPMFAMFIWMVSRPGVVGPNEFGEDPLA